MDVKRTWRGAALFFAAVGAVISLLLFDLKWVPRADFDILGIGWLFMNIVPLGIIAVVILCFGAAVYFWIRSFWTGH